MGMDFSRCDLSWTHVIGAWVFAATVLVLAYVAVRRGWFE